MLSTLTMEPRLKPLHLSGKHIFQVSLRGPIGLVHALEMDKRFKLEGHEVPAIEAGHARIDDSIDLYVPDSSLMVAGDIS